MSKHHKIFVLIALFLLTLGCFTVSEPQDSLPDLSEDDVKLAELEELSFHFDRLESNFNELKEGFNRITEGDYGPCKEPYFLSLLDFEDEYYAEYEEFYDNSKYARFVVGKLSVVDTDSIRRNCLDLIAWGFVD